MVCPQFSSISRFRIINKNQIFPVFFCLLKGVYLNQITDNRKTGLKWRSSRSEMFFKISALKILQISQENTWVGVPF